LDEGADRFNPITGKEVVPSHDPNTKTIGGIIGIYDAKTKGFVSLADAGGDPPAGSGGPARAAGLGTLDLLRRHRDGNTNGAY
jgi:hypothetical protein